MIASLILAALEKSTELKDNAPNSHNDEASQVSIECVVEIGDLTVFDLLNNEHFIREATRIEGDTSYQKI